MEMTNNNHQFLRGDYQIPPTYPTFIVQSKSHDKLTILCKKGVERVFPLRFSHFKCLRQTAVTGKSDTLILLLAAQASLNLTPVGISIPNPSPYSYAATSIEADAILII